MWTTPIGQEVLRPTPLNPLSLYLCCAWVNIVPLYSFAEYDATFGVPDLIVVPAIPSATSGNPDAAVL